MNAPNTNAPNTRAPNESTPNRSTTEDDNPSPVCDSEAPEAEVRDSEVPNATPPDVKRGAHRVGTRVGNYEVLEVLGRGGMGIIYKARDRSLDRVAALKFLPVSQAREKASRQRFLREARALAKLVHRNIPSIYGIDRADETHYIAFEYVEGRNLHELLQDEGTLGVRRALEIVREVADALVATHASGIVHRDIKLDNIMVDVDGCVKVLDFGLAKPILGGTRITQSDLYLGTPEYCSPEQIRGEDIDARGDLYSLGVVLYELLAGVAPFRATDTTALYPAILRGKRPSIRKVRRDVPRGVDALIRKLLDRDRERRLSSASALIEAIDTLLAKLGDPSETSGPQGTGRTSPGSTGFERQPRSGASRSQADTKSDFRRPLASKPRRSSSVKSLASRLSAVLFGVVAVLGIAVRFFG